MSNTKSASTRLRENTNAKHAIGKTTSPSHQPSSTHSSALFASHLLPSISTRESTTQEQGLTSKRPRTKPPERQKQKDKNVSMTPSGQFAVGIRNVTHSLPARPPRPPHFSLFLLSVSDTQPTDQPNAPEYTKPQEKKTKKMAAGDALGARVGVQKEYCK